MANSSNRNFSQKEIRILLLLLFLSFFSVFISRYERLYDPDAISSAAKTDTVAVYLHEPGSFEALIDAFREQDVRFNKTELIWAGRIFGWNYFRPGRYEIKGFTNYDAFLSRLTQGRDDVRTWGTGARRLDRRRGWSRRCLRLRGRDPGRDRYPSGGEPTRRR